MSLLSRAVQLVRGRARIAGWVADALKDGTFDPVLAQEIGNALISALPQPHTLRDARVCMDLGITAARGLYGHMESIEL